MIKKIEKEVKFLEVYQYLISGGIVYHVKSGDYIYICSFAKKLRAIGCLQRFQENKEENSSFVEYEFIDFISSKFMLCEVV